MRKDSQLKLNIDTVEAGEEREGKAKLSNPPKSFGDDRSPWLGKRPNYCPLIG